MTIQNLLNKTRGRYELTIFWEGTMDRVCEDEEIPDHVDEKIRYGKYIPDWDSIKNHSVTEIHVTMNRNYNGPAIWVTIER